MSNIEMQGQSILNEMMCDEVGKGDELPISCLKQVPAGPQGPQGHVKISHIVQGRQHILRND